MISIQLPQGIAHGEVVDDVARYRGIPYAAPFRRFESPQPVATGQNITTSATTPSAGPIPPQKPSRLTIVNGDFPPPPHTGPQDESNCGVLSVYQPPSARAAGARLPVMVQIHGGAFVSGSSQISWYDGSRLARDGGAVIVCISYRLGAFGYMYREGQTASPGFQDAVTAFEWIRDNIASFGGDPANVTAMGQSAGAYTVQLMLDRRPDLFRRAILQSSPADVCMTPDIAARVAASVVESLPEGVTPETATTEQFLDASAAAIPKNKDLLIAYAPVVFDAVPPGGRVAVEPGQEKDVLVGWMRDDGSCFAALQKGLASISCEDPLSVSLTDSIFKKPSLDVAERLKARGHRVTPFVHNWRPDGLEMGATHCGDLPLVFGDEEAWKRSPVLAQAPWAEWERRGKLIRHAWGAFARDGTVPEGLEDVVMNAA